MDILDADLNISISVRSLSEEFRCPVCCDTIHDCHITTCGHNFCGQCIKEWLNRKPQCPMCGTACDPKSISPNKSFDRLAQIIQTEKDKSSKAYFEGLTKNDPELSPIEQLFHHHMKKSLSGYNDYYQKLKKKSDDQKEEIRKDYAARLQQKSLPNENAQMLKAELESKIQAEEKAFERSVALLLESYEQFLDKSTPAPQFLPVCLDIVVESTGQNFPSISVKPTDTTKEIKQLLSEKFQKLGDPITRWSQENVFALQMKAGEPPTLITSEDVPIIQYRPQPGTKLIVKGTLLLKSSAPKQCFKMSFSPEQNALVDYYGCKDCKFNWICKTCAQTCHADQGHTIVEYVQQHKPTWACCYCPKKGKHKCKFFEAEKA